MVLVIFEGPDGGGKSTLIEHVKSKMVIDACIVSEGPEKYKGEMDDRVRRYHALARAQRNAPLIFDRHPCISQPIYGLIHNQPPPAVELVNYLYAFKPFIIYCRPMGGPNHTASEAEWDTPEFLANVDRNFDKLVAEYDAWSLRHANLTYRIGDPMDRIVDIINTLEGDPQ